MDAIQQVRAEVRSEFNTRFDALSNNQASNAGGDTAAAAAAAQMSSSSTLPKDEPLVNSMGKPEKRDETHVSTFAIQCSYCEGDIPKSIAKHCADCDLQYHPGHFQLHRDEWPCPLVDYDLCPWCAEHIEEEENVIQCKVCHHTLHAHCHVKHNPCPEGWNNKEPKSGL